MKLSRRALIKSAGLLGILMLFSPCGYVLASKLGKLTLSDEVLSKFVVNLKNGVIHNTFDCKEHLPKRHRPLTEEDVEKLLFSSKNRDARILRQIGFAQKAKGNLNDAIVLWKVSLRIRPWDISLIHELIKLQDSEQQKINLLNEFYEILSKKVKVSCRDQKASARALSKIKNMLKIYNK